MCPESCDPGKIAEERLVFFESPRDKNWDEVWDLGVEEKRKGGPPEIN